uniref:Sperm-tail PG-rich repeat containing 3 n=1 Tax=Monodelphis domestica TaxID=13616 RepID=F6WYH2_MONDO
MNFDQKAVKFLANFYMNGGQHWTHGGIQTRQSTPPSGNVKDFSKCRAMWDIGRSETISRLGEGAVAQCSSETQFCLLCLGFERRPPILIDMNTPGPTQYSVPDVSIRESSPHPQYSISCKAPIRDGGGRRAWQTTWFQSESPFTQKADFLREKKPCSLGPQQPCRPSFPAFTFGPGGWFPRLVSEAGVSLTSNSTEEMRPSPNTYNVVPGFQLKGTRSPAFSMSRAQSLNTWISPARTPGPAAYYVEDSYNSRYPSTPGVLIQGERRPKKHETGPFCSL